MGVQTTMQVKCDFKFGECPESASGSEASLIDGGWTFWDYDDNWDDGNKADEWIRQAMCPSCSDAQQKNAFAEVARYAASGDGIVMRGRAWEGDAAYVHASYDSGYKGGELCIESFDVQGHHAFLRLSRRQVERVVQLIIDKGGDFARIKGVG